MFIGIFKSLCFFFFCVFCAANLLSLVLFLFGVSGWVFLILNGIAVLANGLIFLIYLANIFEASKRYSIPKQECADMFLEYMDDEEVGSETSFELYVWRRVNEAPCVN